MSDEIREEDDGYADRAKREADESANRTPEDHEPSPNVLENLVERVKATVGVVLEPAVLEALVALRNDNMGAFATLRAQLQKVRDFPRKDFNEAIKAKGEEVAARNRAARAAQAAAGGGGEQPPIGPEDDAHMYEPPTPPPAWKLKLIRNKFGDAEGNITNCITALTEAPEWNGVVAFNQFTNTVEAVRPPPWNPADAPDGGGKPGEWADSDDNRLVSWLAREEIHVATGVARNAVNVVAQKRMFHPVRDYLNSLEWDGVPRLGTWLAKYCGAKSEPKEYLAEVGRMFLISAVARIMKPGCKVDHVIVLQGEQGKGKSTAVEKLLPNPDWFAVHVGEIGSKDSFEVLHGVWIFEFAELDTISKAEVGRVKKFISTASDRYRPSYGARPVRFARQCAFFGTVNEAEFLRDATGNRRFWPVTAGEIDIDALGRDRDQLWAEAMTYYQDGVPWWPSAEIQQLLADEQERRRTTDPWEALIRAWIERGWPEEELKKHPDDRERFLTNERLLERAIKKERDQWHEGDSTRVGRIMLSRLGWVKRQIRSASADEDRENNGKKRRIYVYFPPETPPDHEGQS